MKIGFSLDSPAFYTVCEVKMRSRLKYAAVYITYELIEITYSPYLYYFRVLIERRVANSNLTISYLFVYLYSQPGKQSWEAPIIVYHRFDYINNYLLASALFEWLGWGVLVSTIIWSAIDSCCFTFTPSSVEEVVKISSYYLLGRVWKQQVLFVVTLSIIEMFFICFQEPI